MTTIDYTYFERAFFRYEGLQIDCLIYDCAFIDFMKPVSTSLNQNQKWLCRQDIYFSFCFYIKLKGRKQ